MKKQNNIVIKNAITQIDKANRELSNITFPLSCLPENLYLHNVADAINAISLAKSILRKTLES